MRVQLVAALAVALAMAASGCIEYQPGMTGDAGGPQSTVAYLEREPEPPTPRPAAIAGIVTANDGFPIHGVNVTLGTTGAYMATDGDGAFRFDPVSAGEHVVEFRYGAPEGEPGFVVTDRAVVEAQPGRTSVADIVLDIPCRGHAHDFWGAQQSLRIADFEHPWDETTPTQAVLDSTYAAFNSGWYPVAWPFEARVLPGTSWVNITLHWNDDGVLDPDRLRLLVSGPGFHLGGVLAYSGQTFSLPIGDQSADAPHAQGTKWSIAYRYVDLGLYYPSDPLSVSIEISRDPSQPIPVDWTCAGHEG